MPDFPRADRIRVAVADDHPLTRESVMRVVDGSDGMEVVASAGDAQTILDLSADGIDPDVFIVDLRMPGSDGIEIIRQLRLVNPDARVMIFSADEDPRSVTRAVEAGARAYVGKSATGEEVVETIRMVARGHIVLGPDAWRAIDRSRADELSQAPDLSRREQEVLRLIALGRTNPEIALDLGLSVETIKTHVERLYRKLGVGRRVDAVARALREGLLEA